MAESTKQCCRAYEKFVRDYPDYDIDVKLCAYGQNEMVKAQAEFDANRGLGWDLPLCYDGVHLTEEAHLHLHP